MFRWFHFHFPTNRGGDHNIVMLGSTHFKSSMGKGAVAGLKTAVVQEILKYRFLFCHVGTNSSKSDHVSQDMKHVPADPTHDPRIATQRIIELRHR